MKRSIHFSAALFTILLLFSVSRGYAGNKSDSNAADANAAISTDALPQWLNEFIAVLGFDITAFTYDQSGNAVYLGTEDGHLLRVDGLLSAADGISEDVSIYLYSQRLDLNFNFPIPVSKIEISAENPDQISLFSGGCVVIGLNFSLASEEPKLIFSASADTEYSDTEQTDFAVAALSSQESELTESPIQEEIIAGVVVCPNPAHSFTDIYITLNQTREVSTRLFSLSGMLVRNYGSSMRSSGTTHVTLDLTGIGPGTYVLVFNVSGAYITKKLTIY